MRVVVRYIGAVRQMMHQPLTSLALEALVLEALLLDAQRCLPNSFLVAIFGNAVDRNVC